MQDMSRPAPFAAGSVSLRLYPHSDLDAGAVVRELCDQAGLGSRRRVRTGS